MSAGPVHGVAPPGDPSAEPTEEQVKEAVEGIQSYRGFFQILNSELLVAAWTSIARDEEQMLRVLRRLDRVSVEKVLPLPGCRVRRPARDAALEQNIVLAHVNLVLCREPRSAEAERFRRALRRLRLRRKLRARAITIVRHVSAWADAFLQDWLFWDFLYAHERLGLGPRPTPKTCTKQEVQERARRFLGLPLAPWLQGGFPSPPSFHPAFGLLP